MPLEASSSFRRCGLRDDRRRRLLTDDLSDPDDASPCRVWPDDGTPPRKSEYYGNAEFLERQWQLLDLVPRRLLVLTLLLLTGAAIIVGLEAAYAWSVKGDSPIFVDHGFAAVPAKTGTVPAALDIGAKGSLACWFSSLTLLAASVAAVLVYAVRRHRTDDYQGRYRVWLWAGGCWFLMATDQAASLREGFRAAMIGWTGTPLLRDGTLWCGTSAVLQKVPTGFTIVKDPTRAGVFLKLTVTNPSSLLESPVGTVAHLRRFTSSHRDEPWWMVPAAGRTERDVRLETQWLLCETDAGDCVMLVPLMDGAFVFTLGGEANGLKLTGSRLTRR